MVHMQRTLLALILLSVLAGCQSYAAATPGAMETPSVIQGEGDQGTPTPGVAATPAATVTPSISQTEAEQAAIYAAVIRRVYLQDDTFGGEFRAPAIYLVRRTDDGVGDPAIEKRPSVTLPEPVQAAIASALSGLPTHVEWVGSADDVARDAKTGAVVAGGAIITLGNIHFQGDGSAQVSASIYVANLAAGGQTYVLKRVDGAWTVSGNTGAQWIS